MATWVYESVTASVAESGGGAVEVKTAESVVTPSGATDTILSISATPFNGYKFDRWVRVKTYTYKDGIPDYTLEDVLYSDTRYEQVDWWDSSEESTTLVSQTTHYTAFFIPEEQPPTPPVGTSTVSVVASPSNAGAVTGGGTFNNGSSCTITATPSSGYDFINWTNDQSPTTITTPTHTFTVDGDVTWTAHFERKHVWVWVDQFPKRPTIIAEPHLVPAEPAPITLRRYYYGDTVGVTVPYDPEGWRFTGWTFPDSSTSTDRTAQFQLNDETIEAVKEYDQSLRDYAVHIKANFYYYALGRLMMYLYVNGSSTNTIGAKLEPIEWEDEFQRNFVYIDESTDTRFEARVPFYATPMVLPGLPKLPGAWVVSRCEVVIHTLNQGDRTTEFNPSTTPDPERRLYDLANYFELDSDHYWITVRFYITRQKSYMPLCTGTDATDGGESGRILCNASGRILYDG